jgi:sugar phosphate isomerase/epimerase
VRLGCSTLTFGKTKTEKDFVGVLRSISDAGYTGVQIEHKLLPDNLQHKPKVVKDLVRSEGLETVAVAVTTDPYDVHFTNEAGSKIGTLCLFEGNFQIARRKTRRLLKLCATLGVNLAVHPHVRSNVDTIQSIEEILALSPKNEGTLSLVFDSAHFTALGWDLVNFLKLFRRKISISHIKDLRKLMMPSKVNYTRDFADIGDGVVDFDSLIKAFKEVGFDKWLVVEVDHPPLRTPSQSARRNYDRLSGLVSNF